MMNLTMNCIHFEWPYATWIHSSIRRQSAQDTYMYILFITYLRFFSEGIYANTISSINRHIGRALLILDLYRTEQKEKFNLISLC